MSPEYQALAQRRAEEARKEFSRGQHLIPWLLHYGNGYEAGALDPVLEEARRAMYRAAILEELADEGNELYPSDLIRLAQAEREKLAKILAEK